MIEKKSTKLNDTPFNFFSIKPFKNFLPIQRIKNGNSMIMKIIYIGGLYLKLSLIMHYLKQ